MTADVHRQDRVTRQLWLGWTVVMVAVSGLVVLATLPPFVGPKFRATLMVAFSGACHQIPARSPSIDGIQLAVCHRCYGIYWGLPLAALAFLWLRRWDGCFQRYARVMLPIAVAVPGTDWALGLVGLWSNTAWSRLVTGAVFGLVAGYYLARAVTQAFAHEKVKKGATDHDVQAAVHRAVHDSSDAARGDEVASPSRV